MKQEREVVPNILQAFFSMTYPINLHRIIKVKSHFDYHSTIWFNKEKHKFEDTEWQLSSVIYFINKWYEYLDKDWDRQINVLFSIVISTQKEKQDSTEKKHRHLRGGVENGAHEQQSWDQMFISLKLLSDTRLWLLPKTTGYFCSGPC